MRRPLESEDLVKMGECSLVCLCSAVLTPSHVDQAEADQLSKLSLSPEMDGIMIGI